MSPDIINQIFFSIGQTHINVIRVGPQISNHIYLVNLDNYEASSDFRELYPEYEETDEIYYNNLVYLNGKYSSILF